MSVIFDKANFRTAVFDLDETLLYRGAMSDFTGETLEKLWRSGVEIIIATGRSLSIVPKQVLSLPFIRYIISACGACVTDISEKKTIWEDPLDKDTILEVLRIAGRYQAGAGAYYRDFLMHTHRLLRITRHNEPKESVDNFHREFDVQAVTNLRRYISQSEAPVLKLDCAFAERTGFIACWDILSGLDDIRITNGMFNCIEVTAKGVSKASGLRVLLERLKIPAENVVAFGDSDNDRDMLSFAGYAVAMGNAGEDLRRLADFVAPPAEVDGAAKAILELYKTFDIQTRR